MWGKQVMSNPLLFPTRRPSISPTRQKKKMHVKIKTNQKPHPRQEALYQLSHFAPPTTCTGGVGLEIDSRITPTHRSTLQEKASSALFRLRVPPKALVLNKDMGGVG